MTETRRTHIVGIDPGIRKCGLVMLEINAEVGFFPRPNQVTIAEPPDTTALIRPPTSKDLATRLGYLYGMLLEYLDAGRRKSCTAFLGTEEDAGRDDGTPNGSTLAIVIEDPRDFPGAAKKRPGAPRPGDKSTSVRTSVATHVTIGAAFGVCLAAAHERSIAWPTCPVVTVPSQDWWPRGSGRKLKHDAAIERLRLSWPALASLPEDCVAAGGVAMYWYCNNLPPR